MQKNDNTAGFKLPSRIAKPAPKQAEFLSAIAYFIQQRGYAPTLRELGAIVNEPSVGNVKTFLIALKVKGYVTWEEGKSRTLRVLKLDEVKA